MKSSPDRGVGMIDLLSETTSKITSIVSIVVAGGGSLLYLLKRPHLTGEQKLVALLVGAAAGIPIGGLLSIVVMAAAFLPACSSGCHIDAEDSYWLVVAPLSIATGVSIMVAARVANRKQEQRARSADGAFRYPGDGGDMGVMLRTCVNGSRIRERGSQISLTASSGSN